jgi:hypothetical protein
VVQRPIELAQFTSRAFTERAKSSGLLPSRGSVGDAFDNAAIESFWGRMQTELLNRKRWNTRIELATPGNQGYIRTSIKPGTIQHDGTSRAPPSE